MASAYPSLKLVTEPNDSTSTVLLDLNDGSPSGGAAPRHVITDGFSLGSPELEGDPDAIDPLWGDRTITVPILVEGSKAQTLAFFGTLSRVLVTGYTGSFAPGLWLRVQLGAATAPVWFRMLRPQPGDLSWDNVYKDGEPLSDRWQVTAEFPCEAFGLGALETIATQTVNSDPTSGTNPLKVPLTGIKGDAPAPLRVQMSLSATVATNARVLVMSHASTATPVASGVSIGTSDGLTAYNDTAAGSSDTNAVGGSLRSLSFSTTAALVRRLGGPTPAMTPGRYKVLALARMNDSVFPGSMQTYTFQFRLGSSSSSLVTGSARTVSVPGFGGTWVDLGDFAYPRVSPELIGDRGGAITGAFEVLVGRASGTSLALDHLLFVPLDVAAGSEWRGVTAPLGSATTLTTAISGETQEAWQFTTSSGVLSDGYEPSLVGVFPQVVPGKTNSLWVACGIEGFGYIKTVTVSTTCYYYPRYLNLPGV